MTPVFAIICGIALTAAIAAIGLVGLDLWTRRSVRLQHNAHRMQPRHRGDQSSGQAVTGSLADRLAARDARFQ